MDDLVTRYEDAVEALVHDPSPENDLALSRAHYDCACYVWLAPWWVGWHRERRLNWATRTSEKPLSAKFGNEPYPHFGEYVVGHWLCRRILSMPVRNAQSSEANLP